MSVPGTGKKVRGSKTGRPIMVILDILGRRWNLRIIWELMQNGPMSFRILRDHCDNISPTILNRRLLEMRKARIIEHRAREGYALTTEGKELCELFPPLNEWVNRWVKKLNK